ncbi:MAG: 2-oxoglutarate and iron-dependent oxygenase domain-containing protein [Paracoccaceae bacterium]
MNNDLIARLDDRLRDRRESFDRIPVVDLAPLLDGSDRMAVARQIRWALSNAGFLHVRNHGIPEALIDDLFDVARRFFDLPMSDKMALHMGQSGVALRGYAGPFERAADPARTHDLLESFDIGPERAALEGPFFGPNQWPLGFLRFRRLTLAYHDRMVTLARQVLGGIALSLDLPEGFFGPMVQDPISILRLLHEPPRNARAEGDVIDIGAQRDHGNLAIRAQDDVGGLQVMNRDGHWIEVPPIRGTLVINIGDLMQRLTTDLYLANLHRVINIAGSERYAIPFFMDADFDAVIAPLPSCLSSANPQRHPPINCGAHSFARRAARPAPVEDPAT